MERLQALIAKRLAEIQGDPKASVDQSRLTSKSENIMPPVHVVNISDPNNIASDFVKESNREGFEGTREWEARELAIQDLLNEMKPERKGR